MSPGAEGFAALAERLRGDPAVAEGTGFGSSPGLRVSGKIFAMLAGDRLVLKLPRDRCAELVTAGLADPFDRGQGRPLKEWIALPPGTEGRWEALVAEALTFVRPAPRRAER